MLKERLTANRCPKTHVFLKSVGLNGHVGGAAAFAVDKIHRRP